MGQGCRIGAMQGGGGAVVGIGLGAWMSTKLSGAWDAFSSWAMAPADTSGGTHDDVITLYRGVAAEHPGYAEALLGIATPRGGNASITDHIFGNTNSGYTSWTSNWATAEYFASKGSGRGVVLTKDFSRKSVISAVSPYDENEYLAPGVVKGAFPIKVPAW